MSKRKECADQLRRLIDGGCGMHVRFPDAAIQPDGAITAPGPMSKLMVCIDSDGVALLGVQSLGAMAAIHFDPDGGSPRTCAALLALAKAIELDCKERPGTGVAL